MTTTSTSISPAVFVKMALDAWNTQNSRVEGLANTLTEGQLSAETAMGRNSGKYLFGHLIAVSDRMIEALGFGTRLHPELDDIFLTSSDKSGKDNTTVAQLKEYWHEVNNKLNQHIAAMQPTDWFTRHSTVSDEDFAKEPHRNKLNIVISRTNHTSYHLGQMVYLQEKK